jgi:hypothetical protein
MFLRLPTLVKFEGKWSNSEVIFNPLHIADIEPNMEDNTECILVMADGREFYIPLSLQKVEKCIKTFEEQNVLTRHFNKLKKGGN